MKICKTCGQLYSVREGCFICMPKDPAVQKALLVLKKAFERKHSKGLFPNVKDRVYGEDPFSYLNAIGNALGQPTFLEISHP